jgi:hypothetical protein
MCGGAVGFPEAVRAWQRFRKHGLVEGAGAGRRTGLRRMSFRVLVLLCVLAVLSTLAPVQTALSGAWHRVSGVLDSRPVQRVLIIGNSRTFTNDMPLMLRPMADAAGHDRRLEVTVQAQPGYTLAQHWADARTRELLRERWDHVVIQPNSAAHWDAAASESFMQNGAALVAEAQRAGSPVSMVVSWTLGPGYAKNDPGFGDRYFGRIQADFANLSARTGVPLINLGPAWREAMNSRPPIRMDTDGNHPSVQGSYFYALVLGAYLTGRDLSAIPYVPKGVDADEAVRLRTIANVARR